MKKIVMQPHQDETRFGGRVGPYSGWQISPTWGAFNTHHTNKRPWTLYHLSTRRWVASFPLRHHVVWLAEALDCIGDWSLGVPEHNLEQVLAVFKDIRGRVAVDMAERALASARKKEEKDALREP